MMYRRRGEDLRRAISLTLCWVSWVGAAIMTFWVVSAPDYDTGRRQFGVAVVFLIGVGVSASLIRMRYKLADTIAEVFQIGIKLGRERQKGEPTLPEDEQTKTVL